MRSMVEGTKRKLELDEPTTVYRRSPALEKGGQEALTIQLSLRKGGQETVSVPLPLERAD